MLQKSSKSKASINFCNGDFLKFSKLKIFTNKKNKFLERSSSFITNSNYVEKETKAETQLIEDDKDKIIQKLNQRISELESRIKKLEARDKTPKPSHSKEKTQKTQKSFQKQSSESMKAKILKVSNSSQKLTDKNNIRTNQKVQMNLMYNFKILTKSKLKNLTLNSNARTDPIFLKRFRSLEAKKCRAETNPNTNTNSFCTRNSYYRTEYQSFENSSCHTLCNNSPSKQTSVTSTNIKLIPKVPLKRNESEGISPLKGFISAKSMKKEFREIKERTQKLLGYIFEVKSREPSLKGRNLAKSRNKN